MVVIGALVMGVAAPAGAATASFSAAPSTTVPVGTTVTFTSTSVEEPVGTEITSQDWTLPDGTVVSGPSASYTFTTVGTFNVTLTVTDAAGTVTTATAAITVTRLPSVSFGASRAVAVVGQEVTFNPRSSTAAGETISSAVWTFGTELLPVVGPPQQIVRTFALPGTYPLGLSVTDSRGLTAVAPARSIRIHSRPTAAFSASPAAPVVGQEVVLTSVSSDPDGPIEDEDWDLDGDGEFDDATGTRVRGAFTTAGLHTVRLRVRDEDGVAARTSKLFNVQKSAWLAPITPSGQVNESAAPPAAITSEPFLRMLKPFPVVRMAGWREMTGARIEVLGVRAPKGARVLVQCRGKRCPVKRMTKSVSKTKPKPVRLTRFHRFFPAGSVIEIFVRRNDRLGKYTRFKIQGERKRWKRMDGCAPPTSTRAVTCPAE
jgi:PKD repeat protein